MLEVQGAAITNGQPSMPWQAQASLQGRDLQPSSQHDTTISCHAACFPQGCTLEDTVEQKELTSLQLCLQMALPLGAKRNEKQCKPWNLGSTTAKLLIPELHRPVSAISFATVVSRSSADESSPSSNFINYFKISGKGSPNPDPLLLLTQM